MRLHYCRCGKRSLEDEFDFSGVAGQQLPGTAEGNAEVEIVLARDFAKLGGMIEVTHPQLQGTFQVKIPANVAEGVRLRLASAGPNGCDLLLKVIFYPPSTGFFVTEKLCLVCGAEQSKAQAKPGPETSANSSELDNFSTNSTASIRPEAQASVCHSARSLFSRLRRGIKILLEVLLGLSALTLGSGLLFAGIVIPYIFFFGENKPPWMTLIFSPLMAVLGVLLPRWIVRDQSKSLLAAFCLESLVSQTARGDFKPEPRRLSWVFRHVHTPLRSRGRFEAISEILHAMAHTHDKLQCYWEVRTLLDQFDQTKREIHQRSRRGIWSLLPLLILNSLDEDAGNVTAPVDRQGRVGTEWRTGAAEDESLLTLLESQFIEKLTKLLEQ